MPNIAFIGLGDEGAQIAKSLSHSPLGCFFGCKIFAIPATPFPGRMSGEESDPELRADRVLSTCLEQSARLVISPAEFLDDQVLDALSDNGISYYPVQRYRDCTNRPLEVPGDLGAPTPQFLEVRSYEEGVGTARSLGEPPYLIASGRPSGDVLLKVAGHNDAVRHALLLAFAHREEGSDPLHKTFVGQIELWRDLRK